MCVEGRRRAEIVFALLLLCLIDFLSFLVCLLIFFLGGCFYCYCFVLFFHGREYLVGWEVGKISEEIGESKEYDQNRLFKF